MSVKVSALAQKYMSENVTLAELATRYSSTESELLSAFKAVLLNSEPELYRAVRMMSTPTDTGFSPEIVRRIYFVLKENSDIPFYLLAQEMGYSVSDFWHILNGQSSSYIQLIDALELYKAYITRTGGVIRSTSSVNAYEELRLCFIPDSLDKCLKQVSDIKTLSKAEVKRFLRYYTWHSEDNLAQVAEKFGYSESAAEYILSELAPELGIKVKRLKITNPDELELADAPIDQVLSQIKGYSR